MKFNTNVYRNQDLSEKDTQNIMNMLEGKPADNGGAAGGGGNASGAPAGGGGANNGAAAGGAPAGGGDNGAAAQAAANGNNGAAGNGAAAPGGNGNNAAAEEQFETHDLETLGFSSIDDIKKMREDFTRVSKELDEAKAQPRFKSERAKSLHDFANRFEGMELSAARQYLELVDLDLNKEADHQLRFRAFQLKPEMKGYTQDEIHALFMDEELRNFGDSSVENGQTEIQKIRAKGATASAKAQLSELQEEYKKAPAQEAQRSPEQLAAERAEYTDFVKKGLTGFDGIALKLSATLEDGKKQEGSLNFKLDAEKQLPAVINAVVDPSGWWASQLKKHGVMVDGNEQPNVSKFADLVSYLEFKDEVLNQAYNQGRHDQIAYHAKNHRNAGSGGEGGDGSGDGNQPVKTEKEMEIAGAMKTIGMPVS